MDSFDNGQVIQAPVPIIPPRLLEIHDLNFPAAFLSLGVPCDDYLFSTANWIQRRNPRWLQIVRVPTICPRPAQQIDSRSQVIQPPNIRRSVDFGTRQAAPT